MTKQRKGIGWDGMLKLSAVLGAGTMLYAYAVERKWMRLNQYHYYHPDIPAAFDGVRILHASDFHLGFHFGLGQLRKWVEEANAQKPDMIVFTGDYMNDDLRLLEPSIEILAQVTAPLGCYAVLGNHDYSRSAQKVADALGSAGFTVLKNQAQAIVHDDACIWIIGLDDVLRGKPSLVDGLANVLNDERENRFVIMLVHEPDFADVVQAYPVGLQLSGHSHGGQIRLPGVGALVTSRLGAKYVDGWHHLAGLDVHVSRGLGTTHLPFRFMCRPEMSIIELRSVIP